MTAIQECPVREERSSIATTRSLLVGLRDIKIRRQEEVNLGGLPTLLSVFDATVDDQPIALALYTVRKGECVKDYVAWVTDQVDSDPSIVAAHLELELPEFAELVSNTLSGDTPDFSSLALSNGESALEVN